MHLNAVVLLMFGIFLASLYNLPTVSSQCGTDNTSRPLYLIGDGYLTSPNFPGNYFDDADCQWHITSTSELVTLTIVRFYTEGCCDLVNIYDGGFAGAPKIAQLSGYLSVSRVYKSTQPTMFIRLTTNVRLTEGGFNMTFESTKLTQFCNGTIMVLPEMGTITSPDYPADYPINVDCRWRLTASLGSSIVSLTFTDFSTQQCCDFVTVVDGINSTAPEVARLSGSLNTPIEFSSTQRYFDLRFISDQSGVARGFSATYFSTTPGCSASTRPREFTSTTGTITSPNWNVVMNYHDNADCEWRITAPQNGIVAIRFSTFQTENCCDFATLYDGPSIDSPLIARLSGVRSGYSNSSTQNHVLFTFISDASNANIGFSSTYTMTYVGCTNTTQPGILTGSGSVSSPNFPNTYYNNADCQWKIIASENTVVTLIFSSFATQASSDFVYIYDGDKISQETLLASLSGFLSVPRIYASTQRYKTIWFTSNPSTTYAGFNATFSSNGFDLCTSAPCQNGGTCNRANAGYTCSCRVGFTGSLCETNIDECVSHPCVNNATCSDKVNGYTCVCQPGFTGDQCQTEIDECASEPCVNDGTCIDYINGFECLCPPGFSGVQCDNEEDNCLSSPCLNGATCISDITGYRCQCDLGFTGIDCETDIDECESVPCQNGATCSSLVNKYECSCDRGFTGYDCETNIDECSSFPCRNEATCIDGIDGFKCECELDFTGIYCESTIDECVEEPCDNDGTCIDGIGDFLCLCAPGFTGLTCETEYELPATTTVATTTTEPIKDACSTNSRPLDLSYYFGTFSSVNYPGNYDNYADCQWRITSVEEFGLVGLLFNSFSTEECCDFVYIHDGGSLKSPLIQSLSGSYSQPLGIFNSTQRYMFIRFSSDDSVTDTGFLATFATTNTGDACAPENRPLEIPGFIGKLFSANYPDSYDNDADCQWLLTSPDSTRIINIVFIDFHTESCCDVVTLLDGNTLKSKLIVSLAGSIRVAPQGYHSTQRYMFVRFLSDSSITAAGFRAEFTAITPGLWKNADDIRYG